MYIAMSLNGEPPEKWLVDMNPHLSERAPKRLIENSYPYLYENDFQVVCRC